MNRRYQGIDIRFDSLAEMAGVAGYVNATAKLSSSPTIDIDQMTAFQVATVAEVCETQVLNGTEITADKPFFVPFKRDRISSFKKYIAGTIEHAKSAGCNDEHIYCIQELLKNIQ